MNRGEYFGGQNKYTCWNNYICPSNRVLVFFSFSNIFTLFKVKSIAANTTTELLTRDLILNAGEIIKVTAANADRLHVIASIQEFAVVRTPQSDL